MAPGIDRRLFEQPPQPVARLLLGAELETGQGDELVRVRLVEVEAYDGEDDPASHAWRGRTARNGSMYGPAGHVYAYRSHGLHLCVNLVARQSGVAAGVLLRAGEVVAGIDLARARRGSVSDRDLARGPGNLGSALGVTLDDDGADALDDASPLRLVRLVDVSDDDVVTTRRVGISRGVESPWRFTLRGDRHVSALR